MLKSIDLFTGCGGITLALEGICTPLTYCDVDPNAIRVLKENMARKLLPKAPIQVDVTKMTKPPKADIVVCGWPCVGLSSIGSRAGLAHPASHLFYDAMKVLDLCGAKAGFFENVPGVMAEMKEIVKELAVKRGFQLRWTCVSARDVGAPHVRNRWFCLATKRGSKLEKMRIAVRGKYEPYNWSGSGPARTSTRAKTAEQLERIKATWGLMGNSVVPDAVRLAFLRLFSGGAVASLHPMAGQPTRVQFMPLKEGGERQEATDVYSCNMTVVYPGKKQVYEIEPLTPMVRKNKVLKLSFNPKTIPAPKTKSPLQTTEILKRPVAATHWATPRHGMTGACRVLTTRSLRDLPTQVRFEVGTKNRMAPLTGEFPEWLMGYPLGFTGGLKK